MISNCGCVAEPGNQYMLIQKRQLHFENLTIQANGIAKEFNIKKMYLNILNKLVEG